MDGRLLTQIIDEELGKKGMSQKDFCEYLGIGSSAMSAWRKGSMPKPERIREIEKFLGIELSAYERADPQDESAELREMLRDRQDLRILLHSAKDVPPSSVYALIAQIEKEKEKSGLPD